MALLVRFETETESSSHLTTETGSLSEQARTGGPSGQPSRLSALAAASAGSGNDHVMYLWVGNRLYHAKKK